MTIEIAKKLIHHLANQLQAVLGYIELEQYDKAKRSLKEAFTGLRQLASALDTLRQTAKEIASQAAKAANDAEAAVKQATDAKTAADEVARKSAEVKAQLADITKIPTLPRRTIPRKKSGPRLV